MAEQKGVGWGCSHKNVQDVRCHLHRGWCGVCQDCGSKVHAPMDMFAMTGKKVFRVTKFHEGGMTNGG